MFASIFRPGVRLIVSLLAIPLFRLCARRMLKEERLGQELMKDLEQWFRGALMLLLATANVEILLNLYLAERTNFQIPDLNSDWGWFVMAMRILLAIGVIESMPDQDLFSIIHVRDVQLKFPPGERVAALRQQTWPFLRSLFCRHIDRSSAVFTILAVIQPGKVGWACYLIAITQYLIIGLVSSRDKAIETMAQFDDELVRRRLMSRLGANSLARDLHQPALIASASVHSETGFRNRFVTSDRTPQA